MLFNVHNNCAYYTYRLIVIYKNFKCDPILDKSDIKYLSPMCTFINYSSFTLLKYKI